MEDAQLIYFDYLPRVYNLESEKNYIKFLWETFDLNYANSMYQFAYLAFHMLTMSFIYFTIWQIKQALPDDFDREIFRIKRNAGRDLTKPGTPFNFSVIRENDILRLFKIVGCADEKIDAFTGLVRDRNHVAHANGHIYYSDRETIDNKISSALKLIQEIEQHSKPVILRCYENFLIASYDPERREFADTDEQLRVVLLQGNYFAQADIDYCAGYDISGLTSHNDFESIQDLHNTFITTYKRDDF